MKLRILFFFLAICCTTSLSAQQMLKPLHGNWKFRLGDNMDWAAAAFDDSSWDQIYAPSAWENEGFNGYDGYAWYRKKVRFSERQVREPLLLILGKIDDFDQAYFNGKLIGSTNDGKPYGRSWSFTKVRVYEIPPELVRVGQTNTIALRVLDIGNWGGIYEGPCAIIPKSNFREFMKEYD